MDYKRTKHKIQKATRLNPTLQEPDRSCRDKKKKIKTENYIYTDNMRGPIIDWIKYILQKRKTKKNNKSLRIGYMSFC